ncbi:MAG TPA: alpha amylase family protein [Bacillales bacterium]
MARKKRKILWYDLSANRHHLNAKAKVEEIVGKTDKANFDSIVLDVKNYTGFVAYPSDIAPHISGSHYDGYEEEGYDLIANVLEAAKPKGLEVHINVNTFSEGNNLYKNGPAFEHPEWQTVYYQGIRVAKSASGEIVDIDGINQAPVEDSLSLFTNLDSLDDLKDTRVCVIDDGVVTDNYDDWPEEMEEKEGRVWLVAKGSKADWLISYGNAGERLDVSGTRPAFKPAAEVEHETHSTFVNPIRTDVQDYELSIIKEILTRYEVDGIVLDRARYSDQFADFSVLSKKTFEQFIGQTVEHWPQDVFEIYYDGSERKIRKGVHYKKWVEWRAGNIQSYFKRVEKLVHERGPELNFSTYVGSWYPLYFSEGVNWGSVTYKPSFHWASADYHTTGYAETLDFLMTGNYFPEVTREEALEIQNPDWHSVEGSADMALEAVNGATPLIGSLFLKQYKGDPEQFRKAVEAVLSKTDGVMLFDLIYLEEYEWWAKVSEWFHDLVG